MQLHLPGGKVRPQNCIQLMLHLINFGLLKLTHLVLVNCNNPGCWLEPHICLEPFCVGFAHFSCACMGFLKILQLSPTVQSHRGFSQPPEIPHPPEHTAAALQVSALRSVLQSQCDLEESHPLLSHCNSWTEKRQRWWCSG